VTTGGGLSAATTNSITVVPAAASQLVITTQPPAKLKAGAPFGVAVTVEDSFGNVATSANNSVNLALATSPHGATLGGTLTTTASAGVATFTGLTLSRAGAGYTLVASSNGLSSATTNPIAVNNGAATQLVISTQPPNSITAGAGFGVAVAAEDSFGNVDPSYSGTAALTLVANPAGATLGGSAIATASNGVATFSGLTLDQVATGDTLEVSSTDLTHATTSPFDVTAGAATQLVVTTAPPTAVTAGVAFRLTVAAEDGSGNVVSTFNDSIALALAADPGSDTLGGTLTATASNGVAVFSGLTLNKAATGDTIQASSGNLAPATTGPVNVSAAAATQLVITAPAPATITAGAGFGLVVAAEDPFGNIDASFNSSVTVSLANNPSGATLRGTLAAGASAGVATFSGLTLDKAGPGATLAVSSAEMTTTITGAIAVTAAPAAQLVVTTSPPAVIDAGNAFGLVVTAEDNFGNIDSTFAGDVSLDLAQNPGSANLGGASTVAASAGVATFSGLTIDAAAAGYTIRASSTGLAQATTGTIEVTPGAPTQLVVSVQPPTSVQAGAGFGLVVLAEDRFGELASGYSGDVTLTLASAPGGATLGGTVTVAAAGGVATFAGLTLNQAGQGYTLEASSAGLSSATTDGIAVNAPPVENPPPVVSPPPVVGPPPVVSPPPVSVTNVSMQSVHTSKRKSHSVIVIHFSDVLSAAAADNIGAYSLTTVAQGKKLTSKSVPLLQASYDPAAHTVSLTTRDKLVLNPPLQLRIHTAILNGSVQASSNGQSSGDFVATIGKQGVSNISALSTEAPATPVRALPAHAVDSLIKSGFRPRARRH
jgi:hypothetical protein